MEPSYIGLNQTAIFFNAMTSIVTDLPGSDGDLFTGVLYKHYSPPPGHCYDVNCIDKPIMDDKRLKDYNVDEKVSQTVLHGKPYVCK